MFDLDKIVRPNIKKLTPYSSARDEYKGKTGIFLDANENSIGSVNEGQSNRYPDPLQSDLKTEIAEFFNIVKNRIFLGNGSDEAIDIIIRAFCEPGIDEIMILPPTYGMYKVSAEINNIGIIEVPLNSKFQIDRLNVIHNFTNNLKIIFLCSPNNPTGNLMNIKDIIYILDKFNGIVVVDEAYIDFSLKNGLLNKLHNYANLIILRTFSKAWGMAKVRLGMAFASSDIIDIMNKIKPPYNINGLTQESAIGAFQNIDKKNEMIKEILSERENLEKELNKFEFVKNIYPSDSNFLLVKFKNSYKIFNYLKENKIIVRDRSNVIGCENCLRITIGTREENTKLISVLDDKK